MPYVYWIIFFYIWFALQYREMFFKINFTATEQRCLVSLVLLLPCINISSCLEAQSNSESFSLLSRVCSVWSLSRVHPSGWSDAVFQETFALSYRLVPSYYWVSAHQWRREHADCSITGVPLQRGHVIWLWQYRAAPDVVLQQVIFADREENIQNSGNW